jgi:hypothetical protein
VIYGFIDWHPILLALQLHSMGDQTEIRETVKLRPKCSMTKLLEKQTLLPAHALHKIAAIFNNAKSGSLMIPKSQNLKF